MPNTKSPTELQIIDFISEKKPEILNLIDKHHRILLQANPASGKTYFFKELALDILTNKRSGRLVFCAPFLIISDQFIQALKEKGVDVDLKLWGESRKKLEPTDKIITSTFQSFHHIMDELNEDDIVIIDETHALFYSYTQHNGTKQYYSKIIQNLYRVKAKIVLMSGTPNLALIPMLNLFHIKISKAKEIKANIKIEFTNYTPYDIAKAYALDAYKKYGSNYLNIIYFKSIDGCIKIATMLRELGYKAEAITSKNKDSETYNSIVELSIIPNDIQFLVTTNVISTGANINNYNIGGALMINEFSALEIKQFSKRFRKKLDIRITVVNLIFIPNKKNLKMTPNIIQKQRDYFLDQLSYYKAVESNNKYEYDFKDNEGKDKEFATPKYMSNKVLERYLIQESFYIDDAININDKSTLLAAELNKYDDIKATASFDYIKAKKMSKKVHNYVNEEALEGQISSDTLTIIEHFQQNTDEYLSALLYDKNIDSGVKYTTRRIISGELKTQVQYSKKVIDNIHDILFQVKILPDFLEFRERFKSTSDFLDYFKCKNRNTRYITPYTLLVNEVLHRYMEQVRTSKSMFKTQLKLQLKNNIKLEDLDSEIQVVIRLIEKVFEYSLGKDYLLVKELSMSLEKDRKAVGTLKKIKSPKSLPEHLFIFKGKIEFDSNNFIKALINGIFIAEKKRIGTHKKTVYKFSRFPQGKKLSKDKIYDGENVTEYRVNDTKYIVSWGSLKQTRVKYLNNYEGIISELNNP